MTLKTKSCHSFIPLKFISTVLYNSVTKQRNASYIKEKIVRANTECVWKRLTSSPKQSRLSPIWTWKGPFWQQDICVCISKDIWLYDYQLSVMQDKLVLNYPKRNFVYGALTHCTQLSITMWTRANSQTRRTPTRIEKCTAYSRLVTKTLSVTKI